MLSHSHISRILFKKSDRGFTLVEMAIVLLIVALLLGGLLPTISSQIEQQHRNETRKLMDEIRDALLGYAMANGRLPWPACGTIPTTPGVNNSAGLELSAASAAAVSCSVADWTVLPWATLGVKETDAWGNRFTYRVTSQFAGTVIAGTAASFLISSSGDIIIKESKSGNIIASAIPVLVLSHGVNACGAYLPSGTRIDDDITTGPPTYCTDPDQQENTDNNVTFVSKNTTSTFDDMVIWLSTNVLVSRMVSVGKLP